MESISPDVLFTDVQDSPVRIHAEYLEGESLVKVIIEDLIARRITIDGCRDIIKYLRDQDAPSRHRLEGFLALKGQRIGDAANRMAYIAAEMERMRPKSISP